MFKGNRKYIFLLILCFGTLISLQIMAPKPIDWTLSFMEKDKKPYGTRALHESLPGLFPGQSFTDEKAALYNSLYNNMPRFSNYIIINQSFSPDTLDVRALLNFVEAGNNAFIACNYFGGKFADTLRLQTDNFFDMATTAATDSAAFANMSSGTSSVKINFVSPSFKTPVDYSFEKGLENTYFKTFDTVKSIVLGINANKKPNFIELKFGKGKFYLSTVPEAFVNYNFVSKNHDYACKALSYLPLTSIIWDEYYKIGKISNDTPMRVLFNNISLRYAYYLLLISLLVFIIIGIKRKQRIIPVIEPLRNTTLDFVRTVGTLYFQTGNHKNIADKKINYFLEFIRSSFQVQTHMYDETFLIRISDLSGIDFQKVKHLFYYFNDIHNKHTITQNELLKLNSLIEEFHSLNKR
ncbi:MAG: DUF4350 domain-containing protein [Bacteroidota bacterium]|nr:DUF4350 domain-containing protein [Bacteroidota bacterium]